MIVPHTGSCRQYYKSVRPFQMKHIDETRLRDGSLTGGAQAIHIARLNRPRAWDYGFGLSIVPLK